MSCLRSAITQLLILAVLLVAAPTHDEAQAAEENVMLVLDASGSMWGRIDEEPKIAIAKRVVGQVLGDLAGKVKMGVIAYGHRSKGDCKDIQTLIPLGSVNAKSYMSVIGKLQPKGKTPITDAVRRGAEELKYREEKATIILVSDGLETCAADPCALARELESQGIDFTVHVVGFDLRKKDTSSLQCLAQETGGKYLPADSASELGSAVGQVVAEVKQPKPEPAPEPAAPKVPTTLKVDVHLSPDQPALPRAYVRVKPGKDEKEVVAGASRTPFKVKPGSYYVTSKVGAAEGATNAVVEENAENKAQIILNAGLFKVNAVPSEGAEPLTKAYIHIQAAEADANGKHRQVTAGNQRNTFTLPAAKYQVIAKLGKASASETVEISAGQKTDLTIVLGAGTLKVEVLAEEGGKPVRDAYVYVFEAEAQANGKRRQVTAGNQLNTFTLPAGKYFITGKVGKAVASKQIEITSGKRSEQTLVAAVGGLKAKVIPTEGAKPLKNAWVYVFELDKGLDGKRTRIDAFHTGKPVLLPAGKYFLLGKFKGKQAEAEVEVKAGKMSEITLDP